jgi:hypothetical protein
MSPPDNPSKPAADAEAAKPADPAATVSTAADDAAAPERSDRGLTDFVRRALSAGVGAASRSKDDILRVAATEMRGWLDRLDLDTEIVRALSKMVIEVKTEIRFRTTDNGKLTPETSNDVKIKPSG